MATGEKHTIVVEMPKALHDEFKKAMDHEGQGVAPGVRLLISSWLREHSISDVNDDFDQRIEDAAERERTAFANLIAAYRSADRYSTEAAYRSAIYAADADYRSAMVAVNELLDDWLAAIENGAA